MNLLYDTLKKNLRHFNQKAYDWDAILRIAKRHNIHIKFAPYETNIRGYYCVNHNYKKPRKIIILNSSLGPVERVFVALHELGHYFLHVPVSSRQYYYCRQNTKAIRSKQESEADGFALVAMIPIWLLIDAEGSGYADIEPNMLPFFGRRKKLWEKYGI